MEDNNVTETKADNTGILKAALMIAFIVFGVYGLLIFFLPGLLLKMSGAPMIELVWFRWAGGVLIALAIGIIRVRPCRRDNQGPQQSRQPGYIYRLAYPCVPAQ